MKIGCRLLLCFAPLFVISSDDASATPFCQEYSAAAIRQNQERLQLSCQGGRSDWWSSELQHHFRWCVSLPPNSPLPAQGHADRAAVIAKCVAARGGGQGGGGQGGGQFRSRWDKVAGPGGGWTTGWRPNHPGPFCDHQGVGCGCPGAAACGRYDSGTQITHAPYGCARPERWTLRCTSERMPQTYRSRWDKIAGPGGGWTTGWRPNHPGPFCDHQGVGCGCPGAAACGRYDSGTQITHAPYGCARPERWTLRCSSEPE